MMEFYYMMHYVIYRWYRKHNEDQDSSMVYAMSILGGQSLLLLIGVNHYLRLFLGLPMFFNKPYIVICTILWLVLEYIIFFPGGRYKDIFNEFDKQRYTLKMKSRCNAAKIFNFSLVALNLLLLILGDYINHH